nr:xylulose kinase-1 [Tanacetum cinerariifolium]
MSLTFADTHNMVAYLNKSDASEGFNHVIDFLNGSYIKYALTINPHIYVSCLKQFWNTVLVKQTNDVTRLQALVDKKKMVITEATIRDALCLDDAEGVDCLPNEEIYVELARMGRKINFSKYIFESLVRNADSSSKFYMYPRFIQLIIQNQLGDLSTNTTKYTSPALTQKVFANMKRVGKGFSWVETPLFEGMLVAGVIEEEGDADEQVQDVAADSAAQGSDTAVIGDVVQDQSIPSPTPPTPPPQQPQDLPSTSQVQHTPPQSPQPQPQSQPQAQQQAADFPMSLLQEALDACAAFTRRVEHLEYDKGRMIDALDSDAGVALLDDKEKEKKAEEAKEDESAEVQEVVDVVTTAKMIIEVVTAAIRVVVASTRRRKRVVIRDPEEESSTIIPADTKSKDKGKGIMVEEPKPLKKKQQVEMDEEYARKLHEELNKDIDWNVAIDHFKQKAKEDPFVQRYQVIKKRPQTEAQARRNMIMYLKNVAGFRLDYFKGMSYDDILPIFEAKFNSNFEFLLKTKEQLEDEENRAIQSINETPVQKAAKRRRLNEEVEDLK